MSVQITFLTAVAKCLAKHLWEGEFTSACGSKAQTHSLGEGWKWEVLVQEGEQLVTLHLLSGSRRGNGEERDAMLCYVWVTFIFISSLHINAAYI